MTKMVFLGPDKCEKKKVMNFGVYSLKSVEMVDRFGLCGPTSCEIRLIKGSPSGSIRRTLQPNARHLVRIEKIMAEGC